MSASRYERGRVLGERSERATAFAETGRATFTQAKSIAPVRAARAGNGPALMRVTNGL